MGKYYLTTALDYANGEPHIGHAYEKVGADAIARYRRLRGDDVHLLVGTDDHGLKVARSAAAAGVTPHEQASRISTLFREAWDTLGIAYDRFVRTSAPEHALGVAALIERIRSRHPDAFYEKAYEGLYCVGCEAFRTPRELTDGRCPLHPTLDIERVAESSWFFRLSAFQDFLTQLLRARPEFVRPAARYNEILTFVERGLADVSITRASLDWGIPFPVPDRSGRHQTIYVWFDALPNYLTATGFPHASSDIQWPAQLHVVGKDITRFHSVLWPAVLHAARLPLPEQIWAHGFVTANGARLSKSAGVWIELPEAVARYGPDALRYFLLREIPFDGDGDFSWHRFDARYITDLANTLGNLTSRVSALVTTHCDGGRVPGNRAGGDGESAEPIGQLESIQRATFERYVRAFDALATHDAIAAVFDALTAGNEFVTRTAPWSLATDPNRRAEFDRVIGAAVRLLVRSAVLLGPVIPTKADELWRSLGGVGSVHVQRLDRILELDAAGWVVTRRPPLFPRRARWR